jgi:hypothetical protein
MAQPTAVTIPYRYSDTPVAFMWTAGTVTETLINWMPGDILLARNDNVAAQTITIVSKPKSRRENMTIAAHSIAAGAHKVFPRFPPQDDDTLSVTCQSVDIKLARLSTKAQPA